MEMCVARRTTWVNQKLGQPCGPSGTNLAVYPLSEIDDTRPYNESPTLIPKAVLCGIEREGSNVVRIRRIADETASCMGIQTNHEKERKMVRIPESFKTLGAYLVVSGGVHQKQDKEHKMPCDATSLCIVDLKCQLRPDLYEEDEQ
jgi:hypothetical protein